MIVMLPDNRDHAHGMQDAVLKYFTIMCGVLDNLCVEKCMSY